MPVLHKLVCLSPIYILEWPLVCVDLAVNSMTSCIYLHAMTREPSFVITGNCAYLTSHSVLGARLRLR